MKFQITAEHRFKWPVTITLPHAEKPGEHLEQTFVGTFAAIPLEEALALFENLNGGTTMARATDAEIRLVEKVLVGWDDGVLGDDGKPVPFDAGALGQANRWSWFRRGVIQAYRKALQEDPARGN